MNKLHINKSIDINKKPNFVLYVEPYATVPYTV